MSLKNVLVTGGNKGIGEAICRKLISSFDDVYVILGSRDYERGIVTTNRIISDIPKASQRIEVLEIDVSNDASVKNAANKIGEKQKRLYGIVNNAGIGSGNEMEYKNILNVNFLGIKRVFESFNPLLIEKGRVVNVSSAAGPTFVSQIVDDDIKQALVSKTVQWHQLESIMKSYCSIRDSGEKSNKFGDIEKVYGMSKALVNAYTMMTARQYPNFIINALMPGFLATDLTKSFWEKAGKTVEELGALPAERGADCPCHLLFNVESSGHYYGSDSLRSPIDKYRSPGDEEYQSGPEE